MDRSLRRPRVAYIDIWKITLTISLQPRKVRRQEDRLARRIARGALRRTLARERESAASRVWLRG